MELSPFQFGTTVSQTSFTNRENDVEKLYNNLTQGINTMLISPRRWGKSSLVERVILKTQKENPTLKIVSIDLFSVSSEEEFLQLFAKEVIKASSSIWQDWLELGKKVFKQLTPTFSVGIDPVHDFSLGFDWNQLQQQKQEILDLPQKIALEKNCRFIICLDEFQNLATFPEYENLEKSMRAVWQRQPEVTYCLYGSKRHMMTDIFNNASKPFYRFGDILLLPKIKRAKWVAFIIERFSDTKKEISPELAEKIPFLMDDHSWYVQQFAHYVWQKTEKNVSKEILQAAFQEQIQVNSPLYQREIEGLSTTQLQLLKAISQKEQRLSSVETIQKYRLGTSANVVKNKGVLLKSDIIDEQNGRLNFLDPVFEKWFQKQYFDVSYEKLFEG
ncbi:MAG: hypothetical protein RL264_377 [Bacteroidota bacterium]|jgi:hypothetical protein